MFNITYDFEYEIPKFQEPLKSYHPPDLPEDALIEIASFLRLEVRHRIFRLVCRSFRDATKKCGHQLTHDKKERIFKLFDRKILSFFGGQLNLMRIPMIQLSELEVDQSKDLAKIERIYLDKLEKLSVSFGIVQCYDYFNHRLSYAFFGRVKDLSEDFSDREEKMTSILMYPDESGFVFYEQCSRYHESLATYVSDLYRKIPRGHYYIFRRVVFPTTRVLVFRDEGPKLTADKQPMVSLF
ncbi:MAG TPA: F-box protein [Rhabdochlamydiaceae bacterium]|nr:F-box protein [Rhabdochlamydiaceae bacterium]